MARISEEKRSNQISENVIEKIDKIGKIKLSTDALPPKERKNLKIKTMIYFIVDACIMMSTGYIIVFNHVQWQDCKVNFFAWLISVFAVNLASFTINFFTYYQIVQK